jgi:hypothetical protein
MAKIIVSLNGAVLQEMKLARERTSIGRHTQNDIVLDNRAVSGVHAVIVMAGSDAILEDMNSTNGTTVNGQPIKKHFLQDRDVIELAKYKISFLSEAQSAPADIPMRTFAPKQAPAPVSAQENPLLSPQTQFLPPAGAAQASIKLLNGTNAGKQLFLTKPITTIGRPGVQVTVITQRAEGFYVTHVEGEPRALLNGKMLDGEPHLLVDGDVIDLSGTQMGFSKNVK